MQGGGTPYEKVNARKLSESESQVQGRKPPHAYADVDRKQLIDDSKQLGRFSGGKENRSAGSCQRLRFVMGTLAGSSRAHTYSYDRS